MLKVLHVTPAYFPATYWGGPIVSTYALCNRLAVKRDIDLKVLTTDSGGPLVSQRVAVPSVPAIYAPGYEVWFSRRLMGHDIAPSILARIWRMVAQSDVVHLTSAYSFPTLPTIFACRVLKKPLMWSPRGAIQASHEWREATRPGLKKLWERTALVSRPRRFIVHTTAEVERQACAIRLPGVETVTIPNGVDVPDLRGRTWRPGGRLRLMFLSRLHVKKGLELLLKAMVSLPNFVSLDIYGTGDLPYVCTLHKLTKNLGLNQRVAFHGEVLGQEKFDAFAGADLFILPSSSENFGIAIAEAMAHGVPVLVSRASPWGGVTEHDCGRLIELSPEAIAHTISSLATADLPTMGMRGRRWMETDFSWDAVTEAFVANYEKLRA